VRVVGEDLACAVDLEHMTRHVGAASRGRTHFAVRRHTAWRAASGRSCCATQTSSCRKTSNRDDRGAAVSWQRADKLPKPEELVANAYDLAEELLAGQRKFAEEVLTAMSALRRGDSTDQSP